MGKSMIIADEETGSAEQVNVNDVERKGERVGGDESGIKADIKPLPTRGMVFIKGGTFMMGSENEEEDEKPVHEVTVSDFYMDETEVTQENFEKLMGVNPSHFKKCSKCPVEQVSWYDAVLYANARTKASGSNDTVYSYTAKTGTPGKDCILKNVVIDYSRKGFRLPTEAEWEYACMAGSTTDFYWGKDYNPYPATAADSVEMGSYMVWHGNSHSLGYGKPGYGTHPVGHTIKNGFGLFDMSGNVWEWCNDWYDKRYYGRGEKNNPTGSTSGANRVLRGGSWYDTARNCRTSDRDRVVPDYRYRSSGFRLVLLSGR